MRKYVVDMLFPRGYKSTLNVGFSKLKGGYVYFRLLFTS